MVALIAKCITWIRWVPEKGIAEAGENETLLRMTCSGGTSVIKDLVSWAIGVRG